MSAAPLQSSSYLSLSNWCQQERVRARDVGCDETGDLMMKVLFMAASAALLVSGCSTQMSGMGMPHSMAGKMAMPTNAMAYMKMAHSSDMFEIESSRLALQMSRNNAVRSFAQMMINDHSRMMNEMMAMAPQMAMSMSSMQMMPHHMQMLQALRGSSGASFDMMYKRHQMMAHQEASMMHRTYAARGDNPAMRAMAAKAAGHVAMHMRQLQALPVTM